MPHQDRGPSAGATTRTKDDGFVAPSFVTEEAITAEIVANPDEYPPDAPSTYNRNRARIKLGPRTTGEGRDETVIDIPPVYRPGKGGSGAGVGIFKDTDPFDFTGIDPDAEIDTDPFDFTGDAPDIFGGDQDFIDTDPFDFAPDPFVGAPFDTDPFDFTGDPPDIFGGGGLPGAGGVTDDITDVLTGEVGDDDPGAGGADGEDGEGGDDDELGEIGEPPKPPDIDEEAELAALRSARLNLLKKNTTATGRRSTILTGGQGASGTSNFLNRLKLGGF